MHELGAYLYAFSALASLSLAVSIVFFWRSRLFASWMIAPLLVTSLWAGILSWSSWNQSPITLVTLFVEIIRDLAWLFFLMAVLRYGCRSTANTPYIYRFVFKLSIIAGILLLTFLLLTSAFKLNVSSALIYNFHILVYLLIVLVCLLFVEQILRNTLSEGRWGIKFLCIGIGSIFAYDFFLYADALLFSVPDGGIWYARGFADLLGLFLLALAVRRSPKGDSRLMFSRQVVLYTTGVIFAGIYLLVIAAGGYYLKVFGGEWGAILRNMFIFASIVVFTIIVLSGQVRSRLKIFVDKHFLNDKYDYRREWLEIIRELSSEDESLGSVENRVIRILCNIMDCSAGVLWIRQNKQLFYPLEQYHFDDFRGLTEPTKGNFSQFMETTQWIINLDEYRMDRAMYGDLELPNWLIENAKAWLVVPLMLQSKLYGFVILSRPRVEKEVGWEDIDFLKTTGRQLATHLAHARSALALAQVRQFEAFSRFSAYVIHDLKNLVSQLALVVRNAERHKHNPAFMDDAMETVDNAVNRMNRLLAQLRSGGEPDSVMEPVDVRRVLDQVIKEKSGGSPVPEYDGVAGEPLRVMANFDRLVTVLSHLVQNAQDATPNSGFIKLRCLAKDDQLVIEIEDNGKGMSEEFVRNRLFHPFDTTKGLTGMGIGAHQSRAYIQDIGGSLEVRSEEGVGTLLTIRLPVVKVY